MSDELKYGGIVIREILFRGQTRRKGEKVRMDGTPVDSNWVCGGIFPNNDGGDFAIIYQQEPEIEKFPVYSDTVGQYVGLTDKNGMKIFEDDIVKYYINGEKFIGYVVFRNGSFFVEEKGFGCYGIALDNTTNWEVIGNIFDNPELLTDD